MPKLLTTKEVAEILGCKPEWVRLLCSTGALKAIRVRPTARARYTQEEVRDFGLRSKDTPAYTEPGKVRDELFRLYYGVTEKQRKEIFRGKDPATIDRRLLWQRVKRAHGLCPRCGKKPVPGKVHCRKCQIKVRNMLRAWTKRQKRAKKQTAEVEEKCVT